MNNQQDLRVKPVKRYPRPKYPSHGDPDPTLYPQPVPFPASRKLISAIAASAGLVATSAWAPRDEKSVAAAPPDQAGESIQSSDVPSREATDLAADVDPFAAESAQADPFLEDPFGGGNDDQQLNNPFGSSAVVADSPGSDDPPDAPQIPPDEFNELIEIVETTVVPDTSEALGEPSRMAAYPGGPANKTTQEQIRKAGGNPLPISLSGLPHRTSGFGTGLPNYVQADLARRVIEQVFREAGYNLQANQPYERGDAAFVMDGYDASKKTGFVVVDWRNLDNDALMHWWMQPATKDANKYEAEIKTLLQVVSNDPAHKDLLADIQAAQRQPDPARRSAAFKSILTKHRKELVSLQEIKQLQSRANDRQEYIAVISCFDRRFAHPTYPRLSSAEQAEIDKIADPAKRQAATKKLLEQKAGHAIEALESAAREYIQWAQSQGLN